jgi:hypothetical protein
MGPTAERGGGGVSTKPRRRRRSGSLVALKRYLWATVTYNVSVIEDTDLTHEVRQRASHALVQAAMAYMKVTEATDILTRLESLERAAAGRNGHDT